MNMLDAKVTRVLDVPQFRHGKWWVHVAYDCWGHESETKIMFGSQTKAEAVKVGYEFIV